MTDDPEDAFTTCAILLESMVGMVRDLRRRLDSHGRDALDACLVDHGIDVAGPDLGGGR